MMTQIKTMNRAISVNMVTRVFSNIRLRNRLDYVGLLILLLFGFFSVSLAAQDNEPTAARVLGPQSVIETYDAPVIESDSGEVLIDFPSMISAPGENDTAQIMKALSGLTVEFVRDAETGRSDLENPNPKSDGFISFLGQTKAQKDDISLYDSLVEALAVYRDLPVTIGDLRFIQKDITDVYRELGYPLMAVVVPPQEIVNGELLVQVNEFSLGGFEVTFSDKDGGYSPENKHWSQKQKIDSAFQAIIEEPILSQKSLDKELKKINRNPFRSARVVFEPGDDLGESSAVIQVDEKKLWSVQAGYNNHATESSGTHRFSAGGSFGNLPLEDHQISWNAVFGTDIDEFQNYSLIYKFPNRWGHTVTSNVNYSDTASSSIPGINSASTTLQMSLSYDMEIMSGTHFEWTGSATGSLKRFERLSLFGGTEVGGADFDAVQLAVRSTLNLREAQASNQFTLSITQSFAGLGGNNTRTNFRQFHNSVNGKPEYIFFGFNYARVQQLTILGDAWQGWSTETQSSFQFAFDELAGSDNFALGGANILRAYESSEVAGDEGWYVSQMLHAPSIPPEKLGVFSHAVRQLVVSAFVETGVGRFENGAKDDLWDFGIQARLSFIKNIGCNASLAVAGKQGPRTEKNDTRAFVSCNLNY